MLAQVSFFRFLTNRAFVRQTNRQTDGRTDSFIVTRPRCMQCMQRGKNKQKWISVRKRDTCICTLKQYTRRSLYRFTSEVYYCLADSLLAYSCLLRFSAIRQNE